MTQLEAKHLHAACPLGSTLPNYIQTIIPDCISSQRVLQGSPSIQQRLLRRRAGYHTVRQYNDFQSSVLAPDLCTAPKNP